MYQLAVLTSLCEYYGYRGLNSYPVGQFRISLAEVKGTDKLNHDRYYQGCELEKKENNLRISADE